MLPNAARAVTARLAASALALAGLALPAMAGDRALIDYVGFSQDFRYFAFEEFGIQDGSGFAYSNLYIVELANDSWVIGTPVRLQAESEEVPLSDIRRQVAEKSAGHIAEFAIDVPVDVVAMIGDGAPGTDARTLRFGRPGYGPGAVEDEHVLSLSTFGTEATSPCAEWFSIEPLGYALSVADEQGTRPVHRDQSLPRSRGCPVDYRLHSVVTPFGSAGLGQAVAIVSVYPGGFEGPDRRFLAVPLGL